MTSRNSDSTLEVEDGRAVLASVEDRVAVLRLNRPEAHNALSASLIGALDAALVRLDQDPAIKVIVLTATGRNFSAGADISEMAGLSEADLEESGYTGSSRRLAAVSKPVVAAVRGAVLGGGCELVEMCDIVIAADTATFGHPEIALGTMPGAGGTQRLPRAVGKAVAMDMLLSGRRLGAAEALAAGLVSRVVPEDELDAAAIDAAHALARKSAPVLRLIKEAVTFALSPGLESGLGLEHRSFRSTFGLADRREGMEAFSSKRAPLFRDR